MKPENDGSPEWDVEERVFRRDNYTCQNCGAMGGPYGDENLRAERLDSEGQYVASNLTTLCGHCRTPPGKSKRRSGTLQHHPSYSEKSKDEAPDEGYLRCPNCDSSIPFIGSEYTCPVCFQSIGGTDNEITECSNCGQTFHPAASENGRYCPSCREPFN